MADLSKFVQRRTIRPKWNDLHKDPEPVEIEFRVPSRGALLALRQAEDAVSVGSIGHTEREEYLAFLRAHVVEIRGVPDEDPVGFIHGIPALCAEVVGSIYAACYLTDEEKNA